jgi:hypothetical protein
VIDVADSGLETVFLAHLSSDCNRPEMAVRTVRNALDSKGFSHVGVELTYPDRPSELASIDI